MDSVALIGIADAAEHSDIRESGESRGDALPADAPLFAHPIHANRCTDFIDRSQSAPKDAIGIDQFAAESRHTLSDLFPMMPGMSENAA